MRKSYRRQWLTASRGDSTLKEEKNEFTSFTSIAFCATKEHTTPQREARDRKYSVHSEGNISAAVLSSL